MSPQVTIGIKNWDRKWFLWAQRVIIEAIASLYGRTGFSTGVQENRYKDLGLPLILLSIYLSMFYGVCREGQGY